MVTTSTQTTATTATDEIRIDLREQAGPTTARYTVDIMVDLYTKGYVRRPVASPAMVPVWRSRIYNAARRLGVEVSTEKVTREDGLYVIGWVS